MENEQEHRACVERLCNAHDMAMCSLKQCSDQVKKCPECKESWTEYIECGLPFALKECKDLNDEVKVEKVCEKYIRTIPGPPGHRGYPGETGPAGPIGPVGLRGETGLRGPMGLPGRNGESIVGEPGPPGADGHDGKDGRRGRRGRKGQKGDQGAPGFDAPCPLDERGYPIAGCWQK